MIYKIGNPCDPYTCDVEDLKVAALMVSLLGNGQFYLQSVEEKDPTQLGVPPFLFGEHDAWFIEKFGENFETALMSVDLDILAAAFESVLIGTPEDRKTLKDALSEIPVKADADKFKNDWIEAKISSFNNINSAAKVWGEKLRIKAKDREKGVAA